MKKIISFVLATVMLLGMFSIGTFAEAPLTLDMRAVEGASVRIGEVAGIRFKTMINKAQLDAIVEANGASNVEIGTLITPTQYVNGAVAFTMAALDAFKEIKRFENPAYVKVKATYANPFDTETVDGTEYYVYAGSLENILDANVMLEFSGIGYVKVGDEVVYAEYNKFNSSRTVGYVAYRAYLDKDSGLDSDDKTLIDDFANKFLVTKLGNDAPDISVIRYFETFDDKANGEYSLATSLLRWSAEEGRYTVKGNAVSRTDIQAKYNDGKLMFNAPVTEGTFNKGDAASMADFSGFLTIPGLDQSMYADGDKYLVMEFDLKINSTDNNDFGMGVAYCDTDNHFARAIPVLKSNYQILVYMNDADTMGYALPKSLGADFSADTVNIRFEWDLTSSTGNGEIYIKGVKVGNNNGYLGGASSALAGRNYNLGLYFLGSGEYEVDNLLVYSYGDGGYLQQD